MQVSLFRILFDTFFVPFSIKIWSWGSLGVLWRGLGAILGGLGTVLGGLGAILNDLGAILGGLGPIWGALGGPLGGLGAVLGRSCAVLGRSKSDQKIDPKLDPKTSRIATEKNSPNTTPVDVSELDTPRRKSDPGRLEIYRYRF